MGICTVVVTVWIYRRISVTPEDRIKATTVIVGIDIAVVPVPALSEVVECAVTVEE
jgi:hypothetical protein